jgi:hypothetical protein
MLLDIGEIEPGYGYRMNYVASLDYPSINKVV